MDEKPKDGAVNLTASGQPEFRARNAYAIYEGFYVEVWDSATQRSVGVATVVRTVEGQRAEVRYKNGKTAWIHNHDLYPIDYATYKSSEANE